MTAGAALPAAAQRLIDQINVGIESGDAAVIRAALADCAVAVLAGEISTSDGDAVVCAGRAGNKAAQGAGVGGAIGGAVGAVAAVVAAVGTIAIRGLGLVVAGPIAAALAGGGAGAAAGGLVGALVGAGMPEERVQRYESGIKEGGIMMGVRARNADDADYIEREWKANKGQDIYR